MTTKGKIEELQLANITVHKVEDKGTYELITILGGFNGSAMWGVYLYQIKAIMELFKECWLIDLDNDILADNWKLRIGVRK